MTQEPLPVHEHVALPGRSTDIALGHGLREGIGAEVMRRFPRARRVGLVVDERVLELWPPAFDFGEAELRLFAAPAGEAAKTRAVLAEMQDALLALRRDEPVVVVGGGAVLDVAGFAAATVRRGLPWVAVPTTVVGLADASVGGKVAINHVRGKNLLGAFHPPQLVIGDVEYLDTLDARDRVAGLAELYKAGVIADPDLLAEFRVGAPDTPERWILALGRSIRVKARLVEGDERDLGGRRVLNYGHTIGHALERLLGNERMRHGEAVAIGMGVAARLGRGRGEVDEAFETRQRADLERLGLPVSLPEELEAASILDAISLDKKRRPGRAHVFVLPRGEGGVTVVEDVSDEEIIDALR